MAETRIRYQAALLHDIEARVAGILESNYKMDINMREKLVASYFADSRLPQWYFHSNSPEEIARHLFIVTRLLAANTGQIHHVSDDSRVITYLINVGRDIPGRLERIIEQNASMRIASFDSESTRSGVRIVRLEKLVNDNPRFTAEQAETVASLKEELRRYGDNRDLLHAGRFVESLSPRYLLEEIQSTMEPRRSERHLVFYDRVVEAGLVVTDIAEVRYEGDTGKKERATRVMVGLSDPGPRFIMETLRVFERRGINLSRSYFDLFRHADGDVGILSVYFPSVYDLSGLEEELAGLRVSYAESGAGRSSLDSRIESILRRLAAGTDEDEAGRALDDLRTLCKENGRAGAGPELGSFYLNCVTDFLEAANVTGIAKSPGALRLLLGYDAFDEFFVSAQANGTSMNVPGYRIKHSSVRGPAKGGLRIDPIVSFDEVAALSFMMTWKCARSRILFGGAKGGLMLAPRDFAGTAIDFFDTLSSFGRSLFLVSGPMRDVPAGDVGCGPKEIGQMFEGFKSALRDLAMMAYGLKSGVSMIGSRIVSVEEARRMLRDHFDVDWTDPAVLRELVSSEEYLELVAAAQVTGKPRRGIAARGAATGLGMAYATLAAVGNLYLEGNWTASRPLTAREETALRTACAMDERTILREESSESYAVERAHMGTARIRLSGRLISDTDWKLLNDRVFPALLDGKTLVVQGSGKVGGALISSLAPYGINLIAVADAGGAVIGDRLDPEEILSAVENSRTHPDKEKRASVIHAVKNVRERLIGADAGARVLELECDIVAPAALENAVTEENAGRIRAKIEVCGANGPNSSRAERILADRGVTVLYDFLANGAGVTASYFEWLRNLSDRFRYEAEILRKRRYDPDCMDPYVMPEFGERFKAILAEPESDGTTLAWNLLLRDILFAATNEDWRFAKEHGVSMRTAGFINSQLRVLAAHLSRMDEAMRADMEASLEPETLRLLGPYLAHPEARLLASRGLI